MRLVGLLLGLILLSAAAAPQSSPAKPTPLSLERPVLLVTDGATGKTFAFCNRDGPHVKDKPDIFFMEEYEPVEA